MLTSRSPVTADSRPLSPLARTIDALDAAIGQLSQRINAEHYKLLCLVREFDDRLGWSKWSFKCGAEWLAWRCGLSLSAAREKLRTAHALRNLPEISKAFAAGRLSYSKVRALTRVAQPHDEDLLVAYALDASAAQVEERCRQLRNVEPDSVDLARRAWTRRSASVSRNPAAGTLTIHAELPIEVGELVVKALDRAVEAREVEQGPEFESDSWLAQQADALVAVARAYLGAGPRFAQSTETATGTDIHSKASAADHYQVVVHVDEKALRGGAGRSDLPIETVRRLTCDGSLIQVVDNADGTPLDVGRKTRTVPTALKRALWSRDRGCTFPGCQRTKYVDAHHIHHWAEEGETSLENLTLLCTYHHRLLHEGGFRIGRDVEGALYFQRADGRVIPRGGYRVEDVVDDESANRDPSAEGLLGTFVRTGRRRWEVREPAAIYRAA